MRLVELCKQLKEWSLVKKRPWIQLFLQTLGLLSPQVVGAHLLEQAKVDSWIDGRFSQRLKFSRRQLEPSGRYGFWLPTRQRHAQVLEGLARQITHFPPPSGLYETRYPFLDQNVVEYIVAIPATQLLRPGERRSLMRRALANVLPPEVCYMIALEKQWGELDRLLTVSLTAQLGYVDGEHLRQALRAMKNGKVFSQPVRLLRWPSLELWLRNALAKGVIRVPLRSVPSPSIGTVHSRA